MDDASSVTRVITRKFNPDDLACIYATWRNGAYYGSFRKHKGSADKFFREQTRLIKETLEHEDTSVKVACFEEDPNVIIGYIVTTGDHLEWVFVKADFRQQGIATLLYPKHIKTVTSQVTKIGNTIALKKKLKFKENHGNPEERSTRGS